MKAVVHIYCNLYNYNIMYIHKLSFFENSYLKILTSNLPPASMHGWQY